jgi:tetratricopeptide (TPR) repeat protein
VDSLTRKIARSFNLTEALAKQSSVKEFASSSPEAYKQYHLGMEKFQAGFDEEAIALFQRAITLDSTFALPYMRIGMTHMFAGHQKQGMEYIAKALEFESALPNREKTLLDIYADIWLKQEYDAAFAKMESFVRSFPDYSEGRTIYAILINAFQKDTVTAFAQLDTVLMQDPGFQLALSEYAQYVATYDQFERAIEFTKRIQQYHPESPDTYGQLSRYYRMLGRIDEAIAERKKQLELFPESKQAPYGLNRLYILKRDFDQANRYLDLIKQNHANDPYQMRNYYQTKASNIEWFGKFSAAMELRQRVLNEILMTGDSANICAAYYALGNANYNIGRIDSAMYYIEQGYQYANPFQRLSWPLMQLGFDRAAEDKARPRFETALNEFKSRVPRDLWPVADAVDSIFEAQCRADTVSLIEASKNLIVLQNRQNSGDGREVGRLQVLTDRYEEGKETLLRYVSGSLESRNGFNYLQDTYLIGVAEEGLGNREEAIARYREVLEYWGNPEIEIKEITDTRKRLARLTS